MRQHKAAVDAGCPAQVQEITKAQSMDTSPWKLSRGKTQSKNTVRLPRGQKEITKSNHNNKKDFLKKKGVERGTANKQTNKRQIPHNTKLKLCHMHDTTLTPKMSVDVIKGRRTCTRLDLSILCGGRAMRPGHSLRIRGQVTVDKELRYFLY